MKTIQEHLKNCNREEIINDYIFTYGFDYQLMDKKYDNITCGEIKKRIRENINEYLDNVIKMTPKPDPEGHEMILLSYHTSETEALSDIRHILVKKEDVLNEENLEFITPYGYEFTPLDETCGFFVADNYLTQYEINSLIVNFIFETTFTGWKQEHVEETLKSFDESAKEYEENKDNDEWIESHSWENLSKDLEKNLNIEFEKKDPKQEEYHQTFIKQSAEYNNKCMRLEIKKLKKLLLEGETND